MQEKTLPNQVNSTSKQDDDRIWWNQTNEAITEKIPESIRNNNIDTSGDPTVSPDKFTYKFFEEKDTNCDEKNN